MSAGPGEAGPLSGLRVVDLSTYLPGPYASMLLADLGADVVHVEPPGGDPARALRPRIAGDGALHWWVARNKRSLMLNLKDAADRERFRDLVATADIVIEGFTPGVAARLEVDYAACRAVRPDVIYCSISSFGSTGVDVDVPGHDVNVAARAGLLDQARDARGDPVAIGPPLVDLSAGLHAAVAVLAAVVHRTRTGVGQYLDISLLSCGLALVAPQLVKLLGDPPLPRAEDHNLGADPAYGVYRTQDGRHLSLGALEDKFWSRLCDALDRPDLLDQRSVRPAWVRDELSAIFGSASLAHWNQMLEPARVCYAPVNDLTGVLQDRYVIQSGDVVALEGPDGTSHPQLRSPIRMSVTPPRIRTAAPSLEET